MKIKYLLILFFVVFFLSSHIAYGANIQLNGKLLDSKNNPVTNGVITFTNDAGKTIGAAIANLNGEYVISVPQGAYSITVSGPKGSDLPVVTFEKQDISSSSTRNFTLSLGSPPAVKTSGANKNTVLYIISAFIVCMVLIAGFILWRTKQKQNSPEAGSSD